MEPSVTVIEQSGCDALVGAVRAAFQKALCGVGKLPDDILSMEGMSGRKYRLFINNLIEGLASPRYLEVGVWAGSTLCAATWGNSVKGYAVDNWSQFGGPKDKFQANLKQFRTPEAEIDFLEADFREVDYRTLGRHDVYLFDGPHSSEDQYDGISLALPACARRFVLVVDDWNWPGPRTGTMQALQRLKSGSYD